MPKKKRISSSVVSAHKRPPCTTAYAFVDIAMSTKKLRPRTASRSQVLVHRRGCIRGVGIAIDQPGGGYPWAGRPIPLPRPRPRPQPCPRPRTSLLYVLGPGGSAVSHNSSELNTRGGSGSWNSKRKIHMSHSTQGFAKYDKLYFLQNYQVVRNRQNFYVLMQK